MDSLTVGVNDLGISISCRPAGSEDSDGTCREVDGAKKFLRKSTSGIVFAQTSLFAGTQAQWMRVRSFEQKLALCS